MKIRMNQTTAENGATELQNATKQEKQTLSEMTELKDKRGIRSKHFTDGKGKMTVEIFDRPVHYYDYDADEYKDVDVRFEDKGDVLETRANTFKSRFHKHARNGEIFEVERDNCRLTLKSLDTAQLHACECGEENCTCNKVKYTNVLPDTDIEYTVDVERIKEDIIVKERKDKYEYDFELALENLNVELSEDGNRLELTEKTSGGQQFYIPAPMMFDANGNRSDEVYYDVERVDDNGIKIKVIADAEWINAEDRAFPVTIDPQVVTVTKFGGYYETKEYKDSPFRYRVTNKGILIGGDPRICCINGNNIVTGITIMKDKISQYVLDNLTRARLKLTSMPKGELGNGLVTIAKENGTIFGSNNEQTYEFDITELFADSNGDIFFTLTYYRGECDMYFYPPTLILTYEREIIGLSLNNAPQTNYIQGEKFDLTNIKVKIHYSDGNYVSANLSDLEITPKGSLMPSDKTVKIALKDNPNIFTTVNITVTPIAGYFNDRRAAEGMENVYRVYEVDVNTGKNISTEKFIRLELCDGATGANEGTPLSAEAFNALVDLINKKQA